MDGTLLNSNHKVSDRFFELFHELQSRGIQFVAASGRQYHSMVSKLEHVKDDVLFIAENGALIKARENEISSTPLHPILVTDLINQTQNIANARVMLCGKYTSYFDSDSSKFLSEMAEYYSNYEIIDNFHSVNEEIVKIAVYHNISSEDYLYPQIQHLNDKVLAKISGQHWMDINDVNAHKGNALKKVMTSQGIKPNEVLVFGDYFNDLEMLELVEYSIAMANAHPSIKKAANYQTTSNDDFGVENILEKLL